VHIKTCNRQAFETPPAWPNFLALPPDPKPAANPAADDDIWSEVFLWSALDHNCDTSALPPTGPDGQMVAALAVGRSLSCSARRGADAVCAQGPSPGLRVRTSLFVGLHNR
jgi:hypothetical protein